MRRLGGRAVRRYPSWKELHKVVKAGRYSAGDNLYLQVSPRGTRSWLFRYRKGDKQTLMGLGSARYLSLAEARQKAIDYQRQRLAGLDPLQEKRKAQRPVTTTLKSGVTFQDAARRYIVAHEASWRGNYSRMQWTQSLERVFPTLGQMSVTDIETRHLLAVLEPIWRVVPETARRVRNRIELVLDFAAAHEWRRGDNPARWRGLLENLLPNQRQANGTNHYAALPYNDLPAFMARLRQDDSIVARALEFVILTACRPGEACGAKWSEIDGDVWLVPAERMKANKQHRVPLPLRAQQLLAEVPRLEDYIFPGTSKATVTQDVLRLCLRRLGVACTVHGFRSAFRDFAAEQTKYPDIVAELSLAHAVGSAVEKSYRRTDLLEQRRCLLQDWSDFLNGET
jgi:integrase